MSIQKYLTIGQLSRYSEIHVKALRYYEKIGILAPNFVDETNSYRYYSFAHIPYVRIIKLCADYDIPLKTFNDFIRADGKIELNKMIEQAQHLIKMKQKKLLEDQQFLSYIQQEVELSQRLHQTSEMVIEQVHEDFLLLSYDGEFFSPSYYNQIIDALKLIEQNHIEFYNRIGCYYDFSSAKPEQYLALKIKAHSKATQNLNILHIDKISALARHILPEKVLPTLTLLQTEGIQRFLVLETYETPYNFSKPHLELRADITPNL